MTARFFWLHTKQEPRHGKWPDKQVIDTHGDHKGNQHDKQVFHEDRIRCLHHIIDQYHDHRLVQDIEWVDRLVHIIPVPCAFIQVPFAISYTCQYPAPGHYRCEGEERIRTPVCTPVGKAIPGLMIIPADIIEQGVPIKGRW